MKRFLSLLLTVVMVLSMVPASFASEYDGLIIADQGNVVFLDEGDLTTDIPVEEEPEQVSEMTAVIEEIEADMEEIEITLEEVPAEEPEEEIPSEEIPAEDEAEAEEEAEAEVVEMQSLALYLEGEAPESNVVHVGEGDDIQGAIVEAAPNGTVVLDSDVTVDEWVMFAESLSIGNGDIITLVLNGLTIDGNGKTLTINSIESASNGNRLFYDATNLNIKNLTIKYEEGVSGGIGLKSGTIENVTFDGGVYGVMPQTGNVTITGCTFKTKGTSIYFEDERDGLVVTGCTFENSADANVILLRGDVEFTNNTVVSGRTVNVVSGSPVVSGNDFNDVRLKVYNAATAEISDNEINTLAFENTEEAVSSTFTDNTLSDEAQIALAAVNVENQQTPCVAKIGDTKYATLQAAIDAVQNGDTIVLQSDCDETVTFIQTKDVSFVLDGNKKTYTGSINITARAGKGASSTLVIENFNFKTDKISHDFIKSVETNYYPNNITIQNCSFTGESNIDTADYAVVAVRLKSANNILIKDCTGTGLHSFLQNTAGWDVALDNVDITNSLSAFAMGTVQGATIKNCDITAVESGIRFDALYNNNAVIEDNNITAFIPVVVRKASVDSTMTFNGNNTMTETNTDDLWCAIGTSEYKENGTMPTDPTGKVTVVLNDTGLDASGVYGNYIEPPQGNDFTGYTRGDAIWGETWGNAKESFVIKVLDAAGNVMGTTSLNNVDGIIDGDVNVTWSLKLDAASNTDAYWTMNWTNAPTINNMPATVELWVDGVKVSGGDVVLNAPDNLDEIVAATTTGESGLIKGFYTTLNEAANAQNIENIKLLSDVTENVTIAENQNFVLDLNGKTLNGYIAPFKGNLTVQNGSIVNTNSGASAIEINAGELKLEDVNVTSARHAVRIDGAVTATINGGEYTLNATSGTRHAVNISGGANVTIKDGIFVGPKGTTMDSGSAVCVQAGAKATIEGGNFSGGKNATLGVSGKMTVKGGTFDQNPSAYVAEGYAALPNLNGEYVVGPKPTATVNNLGATTVAAGDYMVYGSGDNTADMPLSFVMQFLADEDAEDMANSPFADWYGDFVITFTGIENDSFTADGCYLAGHYGSFGWVKVPVDGMTIENGVRYPVMLGVGMGQKYDYICSGVQDFKCAMYLDPAILAANPNLKVKLELSLVDNSEGSDAAASALMNNENIYSVVYHTYDAEDFQPHYVAKIGETGYTSLQDAVDAAVTGDTITLVDDVTLDSSDVKNEKAFNYEVLLLVGGESITIDFAGYTVSAKHDKAADYSKGLNGILEAVIFVESGAGLTLTDSSEGKAGGIYIPENDDVPVYSMIYNHGDTLTIKNGVYNFVEGYQTASLIYADTKDHKTVLENGTFTLGNAGENTDTTKPWIINTESKNASFVIVTGGTYNQDLLMNYGSQKDCETHIPNTKALKKNDNGTWSVVDAVAYVDENEYNNGYATLAEAVAAADSGDTITLLAGDHKMPKFRDKELTFKGVDKAKTFITDYVNRGSQDMSGSTVHFENLTINGATENYYGLYHTAKVTYKNCNINGLRFLYAPIVSFEECAFNAEGVEHSFWTYGASNITVTKCTFTYTDRAVNCYSEAGAEHKTAIAFTGCTFTYAGTAEAPEGAVEINSGNSKSIDLTMDSCIAPAKGAMWFISQWDSENGANTTVEVDKVVVWPLVAETGGTSYGTLQAAIDAAQAGNTITLLADITEDVTIGKSLTIDGAGKKYTGNIAVTGTSSAVAVKNVNFVDGTYYAIKTDSIKSITVENCTVTNYAWGFLYANKSTPTVVVKNVTVDGGDYGMHWVYGTKATLENVTMTNVTNGLLIQNYASKTINLKNCTITSIEIWERSGYSGVQTFNFEGANTVGTLSASQYAKYVLNAVDATLTASEGSTVTSGVVGYEVKYEGNAYKLFKPVAMIGETYYETLADAIAAAQPGETVTILAGDYTTDINVNKAITVAGETDAEGNNLVNITGRVSVSTGATVKNLNVHNEKTGDYDCALVVNGKDIVIDGVKLTGYNAMRYCYATGAITIKNSTINGSNFSVHFDGSAGGNITFENCDITGWCSYANTVAAVSYTKCSLDQGEYFGHRYYNKNISFNDCEFAEGMLIDLRASGSNVAITDNDMTVAEAKALFKDPYYVAKGNVTLNGNPVTYVASGYTASGSKYFDSLQDAIDEVNNGGYITVRSNIVLTAPVTVPAGKSVEIGLDGFNITYTSDVMGEAMITNNGELTISGNGEVLYTYTGEADSAYGKGNYTIANNGKLTIDGATIENATAKMSHAFYAITNGNGGEIIMEDGLILNTNNYAVRMFGNGSLTVEDGEIKGTRAVWMQAPGSDTAAAPAISLTVNGGKLTATGESADYKLAVYSYTYGNSLENVSITVNGGVLDGDIALSGGKNKTVAEKVTITGGTITDLYSYAADEVADETINVSGGIFENAVAEAYCADGFIPADNGDGTYGVKEGEYVARVNGVGYESLKDAIAAVGAGDNTITLLANNAEDVTIKQVEGVNITIDGNGKVYSGTITIHGNARYTGAETLTIQNFQFETDEAGHYFIDSNSTGSVERYAHNVTVKDSTFTATDAAINSAVAMRIRQGFDIAIEDCTATDMHSLFQGYGCAGFTATDVTVNGKNGISVGTSTGVKITNANITADGYGIRADGTGAYDMTVVDSTITAKMPIVVRNNTAAGYKVTLDGTNTLNATNAERYQLIFTAGDDGTYVDTGVSAVLSGTETLNIFPESAYVAKIGEKGYMSLDAAFAAAQDGDKVEILKAGTYALNTSGKNITITGAKDVEVVFDNIGAKNMGGANVTFNNVTFDYYPNVNYTGLQHSGNLVYNNCTINGQVFLYGESETFNNCTFNQNSADAYNVWTYGAKEVEFNNCTFNSAGKSVLIYAEGAGIFNDVTVTDCDFIASAPVDGKAAIEMDSSLTKGINLTIDAATTATGFGSGNVSGNSLWNNKKDNKTDANNDITVVVDNVTVLAPVTFVAQVGDNKYGTLADAIKAAAAGSTITLLANVTEDVTIDRNLTINGEDKNYTGTMTISKSINLTVDNVKFIEGNIVKGKNTGTSGTYTIKNCDFVSSKDAVYAVELRGTTSIVIENCTSSGYFGFLQVPSSNNSVSITDVTIDKAGYAIKVDYSNGVSLKNVTITNSVYGFVNSNFGTKTITVNGCDFAGADYPMVIWDRDTKLVNTFRFVGTNDFGTNAFFYNKVTEAEMAYTKYVLTAADATLKAVAGLDVTTDVANSLVKYEDGTYKVIAAVAKIDDTYYETLADAIAAVGAGDNTITLLANATLNYGAREAYGTAGTTSVTINGNGNTLTLNQTNSDWSSIGLAGGKLVLNDMIIEKTGYGDTTGAWNTHAIIFSCEVEMTDVTVNNGIAVQNGATLNNVTINEANGFYGLWINGNGQTVTVKGGEINATNGGRGIKIADQYISNPESVNLTVDGTKFNTAKKAAVLVSSKGGAAITASGVDITNVAADSTNFVWNDADWGAYYGEISVTGNTTVSSATLGQEDVETFATTVSAEGKIKGYYKTLADAFAAAQDDDTITVLKDFAMSEMIVNTKKITLDLNGKTITGTDNTTKNFSLIDNRSELTITGNGTITLTATTNSGWNRYSAVLANNPGGKLTIESGTFEHLGGTDMAYGIDNLTNGKGTYAETIINGGTIKSTYRGIRQFLNGVEAQNILTVNGGTIEGANKSIWMQDPNKNANTGKITVTADAILKGNVYLTVTEGSTEWPVKVSIADAALEGESTVLATKVPEGYVVENANGTWGVREANYVAAIGEAKYESLAAAITAASEAGDTITLLADVPENVTIDRNLTINGANFNYTGTMTISKSINLTVDNVNFIEGNIVKGKNTGTSGTYTITNCDFVSSDDAVYAVELRGTGSIVIENCTSSGYYGFLQVPSSNNSVSITNVTIDKAGYAIKVDYSNGVSLENVTITNSVYGFVNSNHGTKTITVNGCNFAGADYPMVIWDRDTKLVNTFRFVGTNDFGTNDFFYNKVTEAEMAYTKYVLTAADATLKAVEGLDVTTDVAGYMVKYVDGTYKTVKAVAKIGDNCYETLAEALKAAADGDKVELIWTEGDAPISMAGAVCGNKTVTITGTAIVDWTKGNLMVGRDAEGNGKVIFDGANITSSVRMNPASTGIHVSGSKGSDAKTNNGVLEIKNSNIELDYLINRNEVVIDGNSTLTIYGGIWTHGRDASESASGNAETATLTIGAGSTVDVKNENGMGVGGESNGVMTVKGTYKANVLNISSIGIVNVEGGKLEITGNVANNGVINVKGESAITAANVVGEAGKINLAEETATLTAAEGLNVTTEVEGKKVEYAGGKYTVVDALWSIMSSNVELGNYLAMYFYVKNEYLAGEDYVAVVTKSYSDGREDVVTEIAFDEWQTATNNRKRIKFDGIAAKEMADNINVVIKVASTGEQVSNPYTDSIRSYVDRAFASANAPTGELRTLFVDMLNYGAAAQEAFNYGLDNLANKNIEAYQQYATDSVEFANRQVKGTGYRGTTLTLESNILMNMRFYKEHVTRDMTAVVTYTDHMGRAQEIRINGSEFDEISNALVIVIDKLVVADARQLITCKFIDAAGNVVDGVHAVDSVESYCARAYEGSGDNYYEYIMKFSDAAYNYFH